MRSPGSIYRKLKEIKYRYLVILYRKYLKQTPENCKYNRAYPIKSDDGKTHEIRLCLLHQDSENLESGIIPHLVDVCSHNAHSLRCNAFIPKFSKDEIKEILEEELKNKNIRERKYPEICALEWVLERSAAGTPPLNWIQEIYFKLKRIILRNKLL